MSIEESMINLRDGRFVWVLYRDHGYTLSNFQIECQRIHDWFNVLGLTKNDYKIDKPKIRRHDNLTGADGTIKVEVLVNNCKYFPR